MNEPLTPQEVYAILGVYGNVHASRRTADSLRHSHELLRAQRDQARARVADLEAQVAMARKALQDSFDYFQGPEACGDFTCGCGSCGLCEFRIEIAARLAALSAYPSKVGEAHVEIASLFFAVLDALDTGMPTVIGLPCICETPQLHSDECVVVRDACIKRDALSAAMKGEG